MIASKLLSSYYTSAANSSSSDILEKVSRIMQAKNTEAPKLNAALANDNTKLSGLGKLLSSLTSFQSVAQSLSGNGLYSSASASPGNVLSATTSSSAAVGTSTIQVNQLAQAQVLSSKTVASPNGAIGNGATTVLKFDFGTLSDNGFSTSTSSKSVLIHNNDNSLQGIADAINEAAIGVKATVTTGSNGYAITLSSPSGSANSMRIGVTGDPSVQKLLAYNPTGVKNMSQTASAQNTEFTINGAAFSRPSNIVTDALAGNTLTLTAKGEATLVVARDASQLAKNLTNFVNMYNTLNTALNGLQQGELKTQSSVTQIQSQLAQTIHSGFSGASDTTLENIGITVQQNGNLTIDSAKLQSAINATPDAIAKLFTNSGNGIADHLASVIQGMIGSSGSVSKETATVNKDIASLNDKKSKLERKLTLQADALVKIYSQQSSQGNSAGTGNTSTSASSKKNSLFDYLT
ncbi:MAG: flagellar filament capping protein FliD [Betaproteobacteria bacterium]